MANLIEFKCGTCGQLNRGVPGTIAQCAHCGTQVHVPGMAAPPQQQFMPQQQPMQPWQQPQQQQPGGMAQRGAHQPQTQGFWYAQEMPQEGVKGQQKAWNDEEGRAEWTTPLLLAGCHQPLWCCCGYFCLPCTVFMQRRKLLMADKDEANWQYYHCCAGIWGPGCTQHCDKVTDGNGCFCAGCEACLCAGCAMHGNRYMIQLHYRLENTCCDIFLFWLSCLCSVAACITGSDELEYVADVLYYLLMGCMAAQHENEMAKKGYPMR